MKPAAWLALLLCIPGTVAFAAPLGDNTVRLAPSRLKLPQNIGPLRYTGESRYSDRRLGRSYGYNASGISLSIYVYDYGIAGIPDGPDSVALCEQYESAKGEIERGGNYENVRFRGETTRAAGALPGSPLAREALYEFDRRGVHALSVLWFLAADGHFLKLRLSLRSEVADELDEARTEILGAIADAIGQRGRASPTGGSAAVAEESVEVDSHHDADAAALWLAYALELVRYSREHPETRPACGGPWVPGFAAELAARRAALAAYRAREPGARRVDYFDALARVAEAGFLGEYAWHYLRGEPRDAAPPPELRLAEFELFRQRELAAHVVQTGARVRINTVRRLPAPSVP